MPAIDAKENGVVAEVPVAKKAKVDEENGSTTTTTSDVTSATDVASVIAEVTSAVDASSATDAVVRPTLRFAKLSEHAKAPARGSVDAAGFDLYAAEDKVIEPGKRACVKTDIQIEVPDGCYGRVAPRSGLAAKHGIDVGAGVIDKDYRGNVMVLLFNFGDAAFSVARGDRIAQLVLEKICMAELEELPTLDKTDRGDGGFGSTGKD